MTSKTSGQQAGFTLIELLIVAVIVGILATLVAMSYSGVQAKNRNSDRQANIKTLQSHLEAYYAGQEDSRYPTFANLSDPAWRAKHLPDMPQNILHDPQWSSEVKECAAAGEPTAAAAPAEKCYAYQVTAADGSQCDNKKIPCAQYTLTATLEGGDKYVKSSLN